MKLAVITTLLCLAAALLSGARAQQDVPPQKDEPAPGELDHKLVSPKKARLDFRDFTYQTLDGQQINLRQTAQSHKAVLVVFFAAWCENSAHDSETINHLYRQYRDRGLAVIGVCNYSSREELREFITAHRVAYPVCLESEAKTDAEVLAGREKTTHFAYRKESGDKRKWGTPFAVLIESRAISAQGDLLTDSVHIAAGELKRDDAEKLIRSHLNIR